MRPANKSNRPENVQGRKDVAKRVANTLITKGHAKVTREERKYFSSGHHTNRRRIIAEFINDTEAHLPAGTRVIVDDTKDLVWSERHNALKKLIVTLSS